MWQSLLAACPGPHASWILRAWALVWGADPSTSNGLGPHVIGAERPGLAVREVVPPATWAVQGRHRFAVYQVVFRLTPAGVRGTVVTVETYALFPGRLGQLYHTVVISSGVHALVTRLILFRLKRRAEALAFAGGRS